MIPLYTQEEFKKAKSRDKLTLKCKQCGNNFSQEKHDIHKILKNSKNRTLDFCSRECMGKNRKTALKVKCKQCGKGFSKLPKEIRKSPNHFCNHSCSATWNNQHKTKGTRISKLEKWLATKLPEKFPNLEFHFNKKDTINSELDIYIPSLKLAFELNGIFHYEPIFSQEKLSQIQNNDNRKNQACLELGIELCIIDVSKHKYFKEQTCIPFLDIIQKIILLKLSRNGYVPIDKTT